MKKRQPLFLGLSVIFFAGKLQTVKSYLFNLEKSSKTPVARCKTLFRTFLAAKSVRFRSLQFSFCGVHTSKQNISALQNGARMLLSPSCLNRSFAEDSDPYLRFWRIYSKGGKIYVSIFRQAGYHQGICSY